MMSEPKKTSLTISRRRAVISGAAILGMSALLTTTMSSMRSVVEMIRQRGLAGRIKVIVGGAPLSDRFASEIGADAYGYDAANAVEVVPDKQGRILIPDRLRANAGIRDEAQVVGAIDKIEIWDPERFARIVDDTGDDFGDRLAGIFA